MLSHRDLMQLAATFKDRQVLTVYLHATVENPADRHQWQAELDHALRVLRDREQGASHAERSALDAAIETLREWLIAERATLRAPGVVAIVAPGEVLFSTPIDTAVPNVATWQKGMHVAPLLREVSLGAAAAVLMLDARNVHLYRFAPARHIERLESFAATAEPEVERHMGSAMGAFHTGTRGGTASDDVERQQLVARNQLFREAIDRAAEVAGREGWLVLGGTGRSVAAARALIPPALETRTISLEGLDVHATVAEVAHAVADATSARMGERDRELVRGIIDAFGARGRGVAGLKATRTMLEREGVADLILSERFVELFPQIADELLYTAFRQGAVVREVLGDAAAEIDERAEGVVARLRYAMPIAVEAGA